MKTWIFGKPEATGSNGWAGKALVMGLELTSVDRAPAFYEDDARLIADAPRLKEENEQLKLQLSEEKERADVNFKNCREWEEHWKNAHAETIKVESERDAANRLIDDYKKAEALRQRMLGTAESFAVTQNERFRLALETIRGGAYHLNCIGINDGCTCPEDFAAKTLAPQKECQCPTFPHRDDCALKRKDEAPKKCAECEGQLMFCPAKWECPSCG